MKLEQFLKTERLQIDNQVVYWPQEVGEEAYTLIYYHDSLDLSQSKEPLDVSLLYEAWAFDGQHSWHVWQHDDDWVITTYDTFQIDKEHTLLTKQYLARFLQKKLNKEKLVIHQTIDYDEHGQAFITYACPIALE